MLHHLPRILVVDDNPVNCEILREILENEYDIQIVESGEAALEAVPEFEPDLVLLDVMMPGIDGLEVCRRMRTSARSWVKILMVSAKVQVKDRIAGYKAGADDYIAKPFDEEELLAKINVHLRLKHVEEIDAVKCQMLQVMQHGNRTSMTHIMMNADILEGMYEKLTDDERRARVTAIQRGASSLHSWLATGEQLVALLTGQYDFCPEKFGVKKRIEKIWKQIIKRDAIPQDGVLLHIPNDIEVESDKEFFDLMVDRMLCDAIAVTGCDTPITFALEASQSDRIRMTINRGSEPFPAELLPRLLEPFGIPDEVVLNHGDGMSLAVVREIARIHGGLVRAKRSQSGQGAEIQVEMPMSQDPILCKSSEPSEQRVV